MRISPTVVNPNWSYVYALQPEIKSYAEKCVQKYEIKPHISFKSEVCLLRFDEQKGIWKIRMINGSKINVRVVVSAVGPLNIPLIPDIKGLCKFGGSTFHTFHWNHDHNLTDKKIAIIGSAASAVQVVPSIASKVKQLYIFQRTANYIVPRNNRVYSELEKTLFRYFPMFMRLLRWYLYWQNEKVFMVFRKKSLLAKFFHKLIVAKMCRQISNPKLQKELMPDYPLGCKRILTSDDYYPALNRDHIELVTINISHVTNDAIVTKNGKFYNIDTIILATGFQTANPLANVEIIGASGVSLKEAWENGAEAYLGVNVAGFPNFFMLIGPNTLLGHNSVIFMIEAQVNYIIKCLKKLGDNKYIDVKMSQMRSYNNQIQKKLNNLVWDDCSSWYKTINGKNTTLWAHTTFFYWLIMRYPDFRKYKVI